MDHELMLSTPASQSNAIIDLENVDNHGRRRGYPVLLGHTWSLDLAQILVDEYFPLIDQGYELDGLVNHFIGGRGFDFDHPISHASMRYGKKS